MNNFTAPQYWDAALYDDKHHFVSDFGEEMLGLLAPLAGERILDLGCGTGHLTQKIASAGAQVVGLDSAETMIAQARANYPDLTFVVGDGADFAFDEPFDAVFSNAALHWMKANPPAVVASIARALRPQGRLVLEMGGKYNVAHIWGALSDALESAGHPRPAESPWYFPSMGEYASLLEANGFFVRYATHFRRPTPLQGEAGMRHWLAMFTNNMLQALPPAQQESIVSDVEKRLRPALYQDGQWVADYVRLRMIAYKGQP